MLVAKEFVSVARPEEARCSISVVAIMRNEVENLPGLIGCIRPWAQELILVDNGSTDGSAAFAAEVSQGWARIIPAEQTEREGFAGLRNTGLDAATGDWIVHLDCDERVTPDMAAEISDAVNIPGLNGLRYRRRNYFLHRAMAGGGWQNWNKPQIARRGFHRFEGRLHERCVIEGAIGQIKAEMLHLNDKNFGQRLAKSAQYVGMDADRIERTGLRPGARHLVFRPLREFLKRYVWQAGFRDGVPGLIAAMHSATALFRAYALVWDRQNAIPRQEIESAIAEDWRRWDGDLGTSDG